MQNAGIHSDGEKKQVLIRAFRGFSAALQLMSRAPTFEGTALSAIRWEANVISQYVT